MGWSYGWRSRAEIVTALTRNDSRTTMVKATVVGKNLWQVRQFTDSTQRVITLALLEHDKVKNDWGCKCISEYDGPMEVNCPLAFLKLAGEPVGTDLQHVTMWRIRVREHHMRHAQSFEADEPVMVGDTAYTIVEKVKRSWHIKRVSDGKLFRCPPDRIRRGEVIQVG